MILFYREIESGDFLAIDTDTNDYYRRLLGQDAYEGRATALAGLPSSTCTTGISREYLARHCKRVARASVPAEWLLAIGF